MFKVTCLVAHNRIDRSPRTKRLEIPQTVAALERNHLSMRYAINQYATNMHYECRK
jgi:hypothetical protein